MTSNFEKELTSLAVYKSVVEDVGGQLFYQAGCRNRSRPIISPVTDNGDLSLSLSCSACSVNFNTARRLICTVRVLSVTCSQHTLTYIYTQHLNDVSKLIDDAVLSRLMGVCVMCPCKSVDEFECACACARVCVGTTK